MPEEATPYQPKQLLGAHVATKNRTVQLTQDKLDQHSITTWHYRNGNTILTHAQHTMPQVHTTITTKPLSKMHKSPLTTLPLTLNQMLEYLLTVTQ